MVHGASSYLNHCNSCSHYCARLLDGKVSFVTSQCGMLFSNINSTVTHEKLAHKGLWMHLEQTFYTLLYSMIALAVGI